MIRIVLVGAIIMLNIKVVKDGIKIRMQFRGVMDEKNYVWGALSPKALRMTDWCKSRKHKPLQCLRDLGLGLPCSKFLN